MSTPRLRVRLAPIALTATLLICATAAVTGIFVTQEIRKVPVQRLARNLEERLKKNPDDVELRLNLARLYAMAYALKATEFDATQKEDNLRPFFGYLEPNVPKNVQKAHSRESIQRARADLARAIQTYEEVLARAPENPLAHIGHAWALEQSGDRARAIAAYRKAIEYAWPKDRERRGFMMHQDPITLEAAERLEALLDEQADAKELAELRQKADELRSKPRAITPIAVVLSGDTARSPLDPDARVVFDADGSALPRRWTWISRDAGWLVYDADGDGRITSALQLFGTVTFWLFWENGYHALGALDDDADGELRGAELAHLAIWQDANQNGVSEPGEVKPLSAHGIVALSSRSEKGSDASLAAYAPRGASFADGTSRPTFDVILRSSGPPVSRSITTQ